MKGVILSIEELFSLPRLMSVFAVCTFVVSLSSAGLSVVRKLYLGAILFGDEMHQIGPFDETL